jgi:hypothetical protein
MQAKYSEVVLEDRARWVMHDSVSAEIIHNRLASTEPEPSRPDPSGRAEGMLVVWNPRLI